MLTVKQIDDLNDAAWTVRENAVGKESTCEWVAEMAVRLADEWGVDDPFEVEEEIWKFL